MPHRIFPLISSTFADITDLTLLCGLFIWQGIATLISSDDWNRITGPHGLVFVLIIGLIVVWTKSVRDDAGRERRHRETIRSQEEHFNALIEMNEKTANDLKVLTVNATKAQMSATNAIISMDHNIIRLTSELSDISKGGNPARKSRRQQHIIDEEK